MTELQTEQEEFAQTMHEYVFYLIKCKNPEVKDCYIGKTNQFMQRRNMHKYSSQTGSSKLYVAIRENGGWENWQMDIVHRVICTPSTSCFLEESFILRYGCTLNMQKCYEYDRQEYNKEKCRQHYAVRIACPCGWQGSKMNLIHHVKSQRHINWANAPLCSII